MQHRMKLSRSKNQFQNGLSKSKKMRINKRQNRLKRIVKMQNFSQTKKIQNILQDILQNKIEQIKKEINLLQEKLEQSKKDRIYCKKDRVYCKID